MGWWKNSLNGTNRVNLQFAVDVYDLFLLLVEMSSDVFAEDLPSCF